MTTEKKSFQQLVSESDVPVLVDVFSDSCGPCIAMKPVLSELKQKLGEDLRIIKINGYTNEQFMRDYAIRAFPTLLLFHKGKVVWSREGFTTASMLEKMVKAHAVA
jgi:thioredoxin 1